MGEISVINPRYVYVQASSPTGVNEGTLWYDTSSDTLKVYDGDSFENVTADNASLNQAILENTVSLIELFASETLTATDSATMVRDYFSDSTGYLDTIDTGNTTASFSGTTYTNGVSETVANNSPSSTGSATSEQGLIMTLTTTGTYDITVTKNASCNATTATIYTRTGTAAGTELDTASFSGNDATFTDVSLNSANTYFIVADSGGSSYTRTTNESASYPVSGNSFNHTGVVIMGTGEDTAYARNIQSVTYQASTISDSIIQTSATSLGSTPAYFQIYDYKEATEGTGSVDFDISFDNGSNYQTGLSKNTAYAITNTGSTMILKINLNAGASNGFASCDGYGVMFWT